MEEEKLALMERKYREDLEKEIRKRIEMRELLSLQLIEKEERSRLEKENERAYKEQVRIFFDIFSLLF